MSGPLNLEELYNKYKIQRKGVIHIGAGDGRELDIYKRIGVPKVIWVEGNPTVAKTLYNKLSREGVNNWIIEALVHNQTGYVDFNITNRLPHSSILSLGKHKEYYPDIDIVDIIKLHTRRMDTIIEEDGIDIEDYNFLNIDVQGVELAVIKSFGGYLSYVDYIHTEVNVEELYECCDRIWDIDIYLYYLGFVRLDTSMTDKGWGDAIYIRR